jgi:hypothetical protein
MESHESMFVDQRPFILTIMTLATNLLHLALPKDPFRGFLYYAVKPFFTNLAPGTRLLVFHLAQRFSAKKLYSQGSVSVAIHF